jgi:hypothetical protein
MYKEILQSVEGIGIYPIISLSIFFIFFVVLIIWVIKVDKKYLSKMEMLPLDLSSERQDSHNKENSKLKGELNGK